MNFDLSFPKKSKTLFECHAQIKLYSECLNFVGCSVRKFLNSIMIFVSAWVLIFYLAPVFKIPMIVFFAMMNLSMLVAFVVGLLGICISFLFFTEQPQTEKYIFRITMIVCMVPMLAVHSIVPIDLRLAASNDVSTDIVTPPVFSQSEDVRRLAFPSKFKFFEMQRRVSQYPFGQSLKLKRSCNAAYLRVLSTFSNLGWPIYYPGSSNRVVEATASYFYSKPASDFVVRIRDTEDGQCDLDIRSSSRNDGHDMGHNIILINRFSDTLMTVPSRWERRVEAK